MRLGLVIKGRRRAHTRRLKSGKTVRVRATTTRVEKKAKVKKGKKRAKKTMPESVNHTKGVLSGPALVYAGEVNGVFERQKAALKEAKAQRKSYRGVTEGCVAIGQDADGVYTVTLFVEKEFNEEGTRRLKMVPVNSMEFENPRQVVAFFECAGLNIKKLEFTRLVRSHKTEAKGDYCDFDYRYKKSLEATFVTGLTRDGELDTYRWWLPYGFGEYVQAITAKESAEVAVKTHAGLIEGYKELGVTLELRQTQIADGKLRKNIAERLSRVYEGLKVLATKGLDFTELADRLGLRIEFSNKKNRVSRQASAMYVSRDTAVIIKGDNIHTLSHELGHFIDDYCRRTARVKDFAVDPSPSLSDLADRMKEFKKTLAEKARELGGVPVKALVREYEERREPEIERGFAKYKEMYPDEPEKHKDLARRLERDMETEKTRIATYYWNKMGYILNDKEVFARFIDQYVFYKMTANGATTEELALVCDMGGYPQHYREYGTGNFVPEAQKRGTATPGEIIKTSHWCFDETTFAELAAEFEGTFRGTELEKIFKALGIRIGGNNVVFDIHRALKKATATAARAFDGRAHPRHPAGTSRGGQFRKKYEWEGRTYEAVAGEVHEFPLGAVAADPGQPRKSFPEEKLDELAASIRAQGLLQKISVRPDPSDPNRFIVIFGERRLRALKRLAEEDPEVFTHIEGILRVGDTEAEVRKLQLLENVSREDMNPIEEGDAYYDLAVNHGETVETIAEMTGKSKSYIEGRISLTGLAPELRELARKGHITISRALALAKIVDHGLQREALRLAFEKDYTEAEARRVIEGVASREQQSGFFGGNGHTVSEVHRNKLRGVRQRYETARTGMSRLVGIIGGDDLELLPFILKDRLGGEIEYLKTVGREVNRVVRVLEEAKAAQDQGADLSVYQVSRKQLKPRRKKRGKRTRKRKKG